MHALAIFGRDPLMGGKEDGCSESRLEYIVDTVANWNTNNKSLAQERR